MSLYDGLDIDEKQVGRDKKPDVSGWGSSLRVLETQKQLQANKKASLVNMKPRRQTVAPVVDLKRRNDEPALHFNMVTGKLESKRAAQPMGGSPFIPNDPPVALVFFVADEYDPLRPNEYEEFSKRRKKERDNQRRREAEERRKKEPPPPPRRNGKDDNMGMTTGMGMGEFEQRKRRRAEDEEEEERTWERTPRRAGAAIAPPSSLLADVGHVLSNSPPPSPPQPPPMDYNPDATDDMIPTGPGGFKILGSVASKIMARMGYKEGQGLGKSEQGMSTALMVEKTSKRGGKIIHERDVSKVPEMPMPLPMSTPAQQEATNISNANLLKNPSKVILLRNMVGPGEVDEDLEPETAEECQKYGKVTKCVIFEIPQAIEEEAVRIFVEFEKQESAIKALVDLNGRWFGGRMVKGTFYNLDKFRRLDLADVAD